MAPPRPRPPTRLALKAAGDNGPVSPRLPGGVVPRHYRIELDVDLDGAAFTGTVGIDIDISETVDAIVCNAADLDIAEAFITRGDSLKPGEDGDGGEARAGGGGPGEPGAGARRLGVALDPESERLVLNEPTGSGFGPGRARLDISFSGALNDQLRGFYRSTYADDAGRTRTIAATQFQSTDARRAFPCWDEPAFKATFEAALVVDDALLAVSNTAETGRRPAGDGRVRIGFAPTMAMSTYLVAFVVGPLEATEPVTADGVPIRVVHRPGRGAQAAFALETAAHALGWYSRYYGIAYPSDKVDLVALPDFAFGAMENLGCVTFREVLLLVDPAAASQPELERVAMVINHELAHMWFGDLVTMAWWEGIWLNEAFATFMETACTDAYRPEWKVWSSFGRARAAALAIDALDATRPVEYPVATPADAEDMFDVLTYEKGAAVVRMLEQFLGPEAFRDGVRLYLRRHAYANTATTDLWDALEEVSGQPVRSMMDGWIYQGGYPAVSARPDGEGGLAVAQRHFTLDAARADDARTWAVPLRIRSAESDDGGGETADGTPPTPSASATGVGGEAGGEGSGGETRFLLEGTRGVVPGVYGSVATINAGGTGFYRSELDAGARAAVAADGPGARSAEERHGLIDDAWAMTLSGAMSAPELVELMAGGFAAERDLNVWQAMAAAWAGLRRIVDGPAADGLGRIIAESSDEAMAAVGWDARPGDDDRTRELRAVLVRLRGATADDPAAVEACRSRLDDPDPSMAAAALTVTAHHGGADDFARIRDRFARAADPQSEQRHLMALADFGHPELVTSILGETLDGEVRTQDGPYLIRRALANRRVGAAAWDFTAANWDELARIFPSNSLARMLEGIVGLDRPEQAERVRSFLADHPVPQGAKQIAQHLERLEINVDFRHREADRLATAITERSPHRVF